MSQSNQANNLRIVRISGSNPLSDAHAITNLVNTNPDTHYATPATVGAFVDLEFAEEAEFNTIVPSFVNGTNKKTRFTVAKTSDFKKFDAVKPATFVSELNDDNQFFRVKKEKAKGLRISFEGVEVNVPIATTASNPGQPGITPTTVTTTATTPANANVFEIRSLTVLNQQLDDAEEKGIDEKVKNEEEETKTDSEHSCVRCGTKIDKVICPSCGIRGNYNGISVQQPIVNHVSTAPSATVPPTVQTRPITTVPQGQAAQSGNTVTVGTEVIPQGQNSKVGVAQVIDPLLNDPAKKTAAVDTSKTTTTAANTNTATAAKTTPAVAVDNSPAKHVYDKTISDNITANSKANADAKATTLDEEKDDDGKASTVSAKKTNKDGTVVETDNTTTTTIK